MEDLLLSILIQQKREDVLVFQQAALFKRPISTKRRYLTTMLAAIFGIGNRTILLLKRILNFTEGLACDIMEVLDFFYIKS